MNRRKFFIGLSALAVSSCAVDMDELIQRLNEQRRMNLRHMVKAIEKSYAVAQTTIVKSSGETVKKSG